MPRILVIADDLTGAAEIGGIATRFGLATHLLRKPVAPPDGGDCVVYDTDSRLLPAEAAAARTTDFARAASVGHFDWLFKKTDSVLRGEPFAEINVIANAFGRTDVLLLPNNPSRGRCVSDGRYTVAGVPLHQTEFARDPLHPATTADVIALLRTPATHGVRCVAAVEGHGGGWVVGEAADAAAVDAWAAQFAPARHLPAGGADFFEALLRRFGHSPAAPWPARARRPLLYVSGTTSATSDGLKRILSAADRLRPMPQAVFNHGESATDTMSTWAADAARLLNDEQEAMITVGRSRNDGDRPHPGQALRLQNALAGVTERVLRLTHVGTIACEGGATAAALCERMGWATLSIEAEVAPGVVMLRSSDDGPRLIVKPGSYAWPAI